MQVFRIEYGYHKGICTSYKYLMCETMEIAAKTAEKLVCYPNKIFSITYIGEELIGD